MNSKILVSILTFLTSYHAICGQVLSCNYRIDSSYGYTCDITIQNPNGFNNFTGINGTHLTDKSNNDVRYIYEIFGSNTLNIPAKICETFQYSTKIVLDNIGIKFIDDYSFKNCKNLLYLDLYGNNITKVDEKSFSENLKLQNLDLFNNQIEELPNNVFSSLKELKMIWLSHNKLKVIHSDSFGILPKLTDVYFWYNKIDAIDERFINNTVIQRLDMTSNLCANVNIFDNSTSRQSMKNILQTCFKNYKTLNYETTTTIPTTVTTTSVSTTTRQTLPPGCSNGNIDERICILEDKNEDLEQTIENILKEKEEMRENFESQIENLQNQIYDLASRPCACR